jgi:hypothetical protein
VFPRQRRRLEPALLCVLLTPLLQLAMPGGHGSAEDVVVLKAPHGGDPPQIRGEVLDYTGSNLALRHPSGRVESVAGERVAEVLTAWGESAQRADAQFAAAQYADAQSSYRLAVREESRRWAQRRLVARLVWCLQYQERFDEACDTFLALYRDDPSTQYLDAMPLVWTTAIPTSALRTKAAAWLDDRQQPAARLLAASWLLSTEHRGEALRVLQGLGGDDPRLLFLAEAQLWRTELATREESDLRQWQARIEQMPLLVRAGPYFVLGRGWSQRNRPLEAAWSFLRVPIHHDQQRGLAAQSLLEAAAELEKMAQAPQARRLYREIVERFAETPTADIARQRLAAASPQ